MPVRSLLDNRLSPDDNVSGENRRSGEMRLGSWFQAGITAWQVTERALDYETRMVKRGQALSTR